MNITVPIDNKLFPNYIRKRLGQLFSYEEVKKITGIKVQRDDESNNLYNKLTAHRHFDFDARDDIDTIKHNQDIIKTFNDYWTQFLPVVHSWKGGLHAILIPMNELSDYDQYMSTYIDIDDAEYEIIEYNGMGTTEILHDLIKRNNDLHFNL